VAYGLVGTHSLCGIGVCDRPVDAVDHGLEACSCVLEIDLYPFVHRVDAACIAEASSPN